MSHESSFTLACDGPNCQAIIVWRAKQGSPPAKLPTLGQAEQVARQAHRWTVSREREHYCEVCTIIKREHPEVGRGRG